MSDHGALLLDEGLSAGLWRLVRPRLASALTGLELAGEFGTVRITADDLPGDDDCWYRLLPGTDGAPGPVLAITCHPRIFCRHEPLLTTVHPPRAIWEQAAAPRVEDPPGGDDFSLDRTDRFLHHHLLTVSDLYQGSIIGEDIPVHLAEAFAAAWAVCVDGRLERRHLPGYPMSERRGRFSRLFSSAGILLPDHWQVFQSLWEGALAGQREVLGIARRLPRL